MKKIFIFPFNGNAKEAISVISDINRIKPQWNILGFLDDDVAKVGNKFGQYTVVGGREKFTECPDAYMLAVPGRPENFRQRVKLIETCNLSSDRFATIIHPSASIGVGCNIGSNTLIMQNVVLTANVKIGSHIVMLPNTVISHDTSIGDHCMIGSNVSISSSVTIGNNSYLGTGSRFIQEISVGSEAMVGIGSNVIANVASCSTVVGNPARRLSKKI